MPIYRIARNITRVMGYQVWECEAGSLKEAYSKFRAGDDICIDEEIEISGLAPVSMEDIEEVKY